MWEAHVEIARRAIESARRKPKPDFDTLNSLFHPDHEFISLIRFRRGKSLRGTDGFREWLTDWDEAWASWRESWSR